VVIYTHVHTYSHMPSVLQPTHIRPQPPLSNSTYEPTRLQVSLRPTHLPPNNSSSNRTNLPSPSSWQDLLSINVPRSQRYNSHLLLGPRPVSYHLQRCSMRLVGTSETGLNSTKHEHWPAPNSQSAAANSGGYRWI
jgi:hypothetical protein